jgi:hypothetical protein
MIDPQNGAQMLAYWAAMPNLPQKDANTPGGVYAGVCPRCAVRDKCNEIFCARVASDELHFAKDSARRIVDARQPLVIPPTLLNFLALRNKYCEAHVSHIAEVQTPGIVVFGAKMVNGQQSLLAFLIDGTHRAITALRAGREFKAYCLGARETAYCLLETESWLLNKNVTVKDAVEFASR